MTLDEMAKEVARLSHLLDQGIAALRNTAHDVADAEHDYRLAKAQAYASAPDGTVPERDAWVGKATADKRRQRDLAEYMRQAALEAVRSRRTQISALQSLLAAHRSEAEFARTEYVA